MKELNDVITAKMAAMVEDGTLQAMLERQLEKTMASAVEEAMKPWSDFGKALKDRVGTSIAGLGETLTLPEYNRMIAEVIERKFLQVLGEQGAQHLAELVDDAVPASLPETKFSQIMDFVLECWGDDARSEGEDCIQIEAEPGAHGAALYVTFSAPHYEEDVRATFYKFGASKGWHIGYLSQGTSTLTRARRMVNRTTSPMNEVTQRLFQHWAAGTQFDADTEFDSIGLD